MSTFKYAAKKPGGQSVEGTIQAGDRGEALNELRRQNLVVLKVEQVAAKGAAKSRSSGSGGGLFGKGPKINKTELVLFTRQLATMVGAGLALLEAIDVLGQQSESPGLKATCDKISNALRGGSDLSSAMESCPKAFNPLYISMVRAGEASGQMDVILVRLAEYVEASEELKREIKSAMTYPVVSLVLVLSITMFLMIGVVPGFKDVFDGLGAELPGLTITVLAISDWLRTQWHVLLVIIFLISVGYTMFKKTDKGQLLFDRAMLRVPVFGVLSQKVALARFSRTFATLVRSGVPIMGTLEIVADTSGNRVVADAVRASRESVRNGKMLSEPLENEKVFPPMVVRMIAIGERSGALESLLEKIAEFYDSQVKAAIKSLTSLIEPLMIAVMGFMVGTIVLAVFLPIFELQKKLAER